MDSRQANSRSYVCTHADQILAPERSHANHYYEYIINLYRVYSTNLSHRYAQATISSIIGSQLASIEFIVYFFPK